MLEPAAARDKAASLVELARRSGADAADAAYVGERSQGVSVRLGALEDVHRSEGEEIGLRVFLGRRNATHRLVRPVARTRWQTLVERALAMAAEAPEDQFAGLAPEELLFRGTAGRPRPRRWRRSRSGRAQASARWRPKTPPARSRASPIQQRRQAPRPRPRSSPSPPATAFPARPAPPATAIRPASSPAKARRCSATMPGIRRAISPTSKRRRTSAPAPPPRAVARLNPVSIKAGVMPVLFDPRVATTLLGHFVAAISGSAIARQASFLLDALETQVFAPGVTIHDDPVPPARPSQPGVRRRGACR